MSLILNPITWNQIRKNPKTSYYKINASVIKDSAVNSARALMLERRKHCLLQLKYTSFAEKNPINSHLVFGCTENPVSGKRHPSCQDHLPKSTSFAVLMSELPPLAAPDSRGSLVTEVFVGDCHACTRKETVCWRTWNSHLLCQDCVLFGNTKPPFKKQSERSDICCDRNGCGLQPQSNQEIFELAVHLARKYSQ